MRPKTNPLADIANKRLNQKLVSFLDFYRTKNPPANQPLKRNNLQEIGSVPHFSLRASVQPAFTPKTSPKIKRFVKNFNGKWLIL